MSRPVGQLDIMSMESMLFGNKNNNVTSGADSASRGMNALQKRVQQLKKWQEHEDHLNRMENWTDPAAKKQRTTKVRFSNQTLFLAACANGDVEECKSLISAGTDINCVNVDGMTGMHQACIDDNIDMVRFLITAGADVNAIDNDGWTPLHAAANCGHTDIVQLLIDSKADPRIVNNDGELASDIAETEEVEDLIKKRLIQLSPETTDFEEGAKRLRNVEQSTMERDVQRMISSGKYEDKVHERTGASVLHVAASKGYTTIIYDLLTHPKLRSQVSIDALDHEKWTPLAAACYFQQVPAVDLLLQHGADVNFKTPSGQTLEDITENEKIVQMIESHREKLKQEAKDRERMLQHEQQKQQQQQQQQQQQASSVSQVQHSLLSNGSSNKKKDKAPASPTTPSVTVSLPTPPSPASIATPAPPASAATTTTTTTTTSVPGSPASSANTTTTAAAAVPTPPSESETQRKAHAKRVREARRSTQGISADDVTKAKEQIQKQHQEQQQQQLQQQQSSPVSSTRSSSTGKSETDSTSSTPGHGTGTPVRGNRETISSVVDSGSTPDYKKLYEETLAQMESMKREFSLKEQEWSREKRQQQRKISELEEDVKMMDILKSDNQRLKDENGALIRVISKLSK